MAEAVRPRLALGRRLTALAAVALILAVAFGVRLLAGAGVLDSSGPLAQNSGTALYAAMIYAGVFVPAPRIRPVVAAGVAVAFCWAVELFQLTGVPAGLSSRYLLARLALGVAFDPADLLWYVLGVLPALALSLLIGRGRPAWRRC